MKFFTTLIQVIQQVLTASQLTRSGRWRQACLVMGR